MGSVKPVYLLALVAVIAFVVMLKVTNPYREYSTSQFWTSATLQSVYDIPEEALKRGNRNGSVLMWAASSTSDPAIIKALVERGADVNESDPVFSGTPLTGAAFSSANPEILRMLVRLGADVNQTVNNNETALMVAAQHNTNAIIIEELVALGSDVHHKNSQGKTALDLARMNDNKAAEEALMNRVNW